MSTELTPSALLDVLAEMRVTVENAKTVLMSSDVRVNRDDMLALIRELQEGLPTAISNADAMMEAARKELQDAKDAGEETIAAARARALELVSLEQVTMQAKVTAAEIVASANDEAAEVRRQADLYCDAGLANLSKHLEELGAQVNAGRGAIAARLEASAPAPTPAPAPEPHAGQLPAWEMPSV
jgi:uncharacterized protein YhaN